MYKESNKSFIWWKATETSLSIFQWNITSFLCTLLAIILKNSRHSPFKNNKTWKTSFPSFSFLESRNRHLSMCEDLRCAAQNQDLTDNLFREIHFVISFIWHLLPDILLKQLKYIRSLWWYTERYWKGVELSMGNPFQILWYKISPKDESVY